MGGENYQGRAAMTDQHEWGILVVGGGTAGWLTAAVLTRLVGDDTTSICLIESEQIGTVGVGEATLPPIRDINYLLGITESEFLIATQATFKLGICFEGWGGEDAPSYLHSFGVHGRPLDNIGFHHYWLKAQAAGLKPPSFDAFSLAGAMAKKSRFRQPEQNSNPHHRYSYAYHLDATAYGAFLRQWSEKRGVTRHEGKVNEVRLHPDTGDIDAVILEDGSRHKAKLYIDCTGFSALLIAKALGVEYRDWSRWLPCNRALAAATGPTHEPSPYTIATAKSGGWQWRIPLQRRTGNGFVYSDEFIAPADAEQTFLAGCGSQQPSAIRRLAFTAGCREKSWEKNCVAIGLASGFVEPLESTSIHSIQAAIYKLVEFFPVGDDYKIERDAFNRAITDDYEKIRDFIILHYKLNRRDDSELWRYCRNMSVPDSLSERMALFKATAQVVEYELGSFAEPSWLAIYLGQGYWPEQLHPALSAASRRDLLLKIEAMQREVDTGIDDIAHHMKTLRETLTRSPAAGRRPGAGLYGP